MRSSRWDKRRHARTREPSYNEVRQGFVLAVEREAIKQGLPARAAHWPFPIALTFYWYEQERRRDPDNLSGEGRKILLDGLVAAHVLPDDKARQIARFKGEEFRYGMGEGVSVGFFTNAGRYLDCFVLGVRLPSMNESRALLETTVRRAVRT